MEICNNNNRVLVNFCRAYFFLIDLQRLGENQLSLTNSTEIVQPFNEMARIE